MNATTIPAGDELLTREQVCDRLKITKKVLWRRECAGHGPPRVRIGNTVRYPESLFEQFIADRIEVT